MNGNRGQLVLLAAAAIALIPMAAAYLQLGYDADVQTTTVEDDTIPTVERTLHRALVSESSGIPSQYSWRDRSDAVTAFREQFDQTVDSLSTAHSDSGTVIAVSYNDSRAQSWDRTGCPRGPNRKFGPCETDRAVVIQNRDGQTHVLGVAVDIVVTTTDGTVRLTTVLVVPADGY